MKTAYEMRISDWSSDVCSSDLFGGSFLLDKCCHDFDIYRSFIGALPKRVASFGGRTIFTSANEVHLADAQYADGTKAYSIWRHGWNTADRARKSAGWGRSVSVGVKPGGRRINKKKKKKK